MRKLVFKLVGCLVKDCSKSHIRISVPAFIPGHWSIFILCTHHDWLSEQFSGSQEACGTRWPLENQNKHPEDWYWNDFHGSKQKLFFHFLHKKTAKIRKNHDAHTKSSYLIFRALKIIISWHYPFERRSRNKLLYIYYHRARCTCTNDSHPLQQANSATMASSFHFLLLQDLPIFEIIGGAKNSNDTAKSASFIILFIIFSLTIARFFPLNKVANINSLDWKSINQIFTTWEGHRHPPRQQFAPVCSGCPSCPIDMRQFTRIFIPAIHCKENPIYVFLFWELRGRRPNFHIHVSVSAGRLILDIYKSLTGIWA